MESAAVKPERAYYPGSFRGSVGKTATLLGKIIAPRHVLENAFGNELLEIAGRERTTGQPLNLLYAGSGHNLAWLLSRIYADFDVRERSRVRNPLALHDAVHARRAGSDLLIVDSGVLTARLAESSGMLRIPPSVRQRLSLGREWAATRGTFARKACNKAERYVRRYGHACGFSTGARDFFIFYHRFYRPSLKRRFGKEAVIVPLDRFLNECRRGYLIQVRQGGEIRAAALLQRFGKRITSVWGGTAAEECPEIKGLWDALDYFTVRHAWDLRCNVLDFGPSRPFLHDGVLQYKKKWGGRIGFGHMPRADLLVEPLNLNAAVAGFLGATGPIVRDASGPVAKLLFTNAPCSADGLDAWFRRYAAAGVARYEVHAVQGFETGAKRRAAASPHNVALVDLAASAHPEKEFCRPALVQL